MGLSFEQKLLFHAAVFQRKSLFFTGFAGTGKSHLLRAIIQGLQAIVKDSEGIAVTAPTGTAAVNINGCTIHSFAGTQLYNEEDPPKVESSAQYILKRNRRAAERWRITDVLILDECSMLLGSFFDFLNQLAQRLRFDRQRSLFGGIQVILCGDFLQLPPIAKPSYLQWLFESQAFQEIELQASLSRCFRQVDSTFIKLLNETRVGEMSLQTKTLLGNLYVAESTINTEQESNNVAAHEAFRSAKAKAESTIEKARAEAEEKIATYAKEPSGLLLMDIMADIALVKQTAIEVSAMIFYPPPVPVRLYTHRNDVFSYNEKMLNRGIGTIFCVTAQETGKAEQMRDTPPREVRFTLGSSVILTKNLNVGSGLCNGRQGILLDIFYLDSKDKEKAKQSAMYRKILESGTVGSDIDKPNFDTAAPTKIVGSEVSRTGVKHVNLIADDELVFEVRFGDQIHTIKPEKFELKHSEKDVLASRTQIPLELAYALSIHKCQGMTLDSAIIDIKNAFSAGQAYVALSRLKTREGIKLTGLDFKKVLTDGKAVAFHAGTPNIALNEPSTLEKLHLWKSVTELLGYSDRKGSDLPFTPCLDIDEFFSDAEVEAEAEIGVAPSRPVPSTSPSCTPNISEPLHELVPAISNAHIARSVISNPFKRKHEAGVAFSMANDVVSNPVRKYAVTDSEKMYAPQSMPDIGAHTAVVPAKPPFVKRAAAAKVVKTEFQQDPHLEASIIDISDGDDGSTAEEPVSKHLHSQLHDEGAKLLGPKSDKCPFNKKAHVEDVYRAAAHCTQASFEARVKQQSDYSGMSSPGQNRSVTQHILGEETKITSKITEPCSPIALARSPNPGSKQTLGSWKAQLRKAQQNSGEFALSDFLPFLERYTEYHVEDRSTGSITDLLVNKMPIPSELQAPEKYSESYIDLLQKNQVTAERVPSEAPGSSTSVTSNDEPPVRAPTSDRGTGFPAQNVSEKGYLQKRCNSPIDNIQGRSSNSQFQTADDVLF